MKLDYNPTLKVEGAEVLSLGDVAQPPPCFLLHGMDLPSIHLVAQGKTLGSSLTPHFPHCPQMQSVTSTFSSTSKVTFMHPPDPSPSLLGPPPLMRLRQDPPTRAYGSSFASSSVLHCPGAIPFGIRNMGIPWWSSG